MPFSIDHYPPLPSPLLAIAQSEMPASPWSPLCGRCSWEVKRLRLGTFGCLLWFDLWRPHAVPNYWQICVAIKGDSDVARSYCCSGLVWTYRVSMTAGMFAVDEVLCCTSVTSAILWSDKYRRLVESLCPPRCLFFFFLLSHLTQLHLIIFHCLTALH